MKKFIARFLVVLLLTTLGVGVYATDVTTIPPPEITVESTGTTEIVVTDESKFDDLLKGLTNSTFWTTTGTTLLAVIACIETFRKRFGIISEHIANKADAKTINAALKATATELSDVFDSKLSEIDARLKDTDSNEKILTTILTIFITNANINPNAKAEIMNYLTGIKNINGKVTDIVDTANKIIEEANNAEVKVPTPALNSIISEAEETENKMVLG